MKPYNNCLDLNIGAKSEEESWVIHISSSLLVEHALCFNPHILYVTSQVGCPIHTVLLNELEMMNRGHRMCAKTVKGSGHLVVHSRCAVKVEVSVEPPSVQNVWRFQYFSQKGDCNNTSLGVLIFNSIL